MAIELIIQVLSSLDAWRHEISEQRAFLSTSNIYAKPCDENYSRFNQDIIRMIKQIEYFCPNFWQCSITTS
jgi:hypothetical protein